MRSGARERSRRPSASSSPRRAFRHVAAYDTAIFAYLSRLRPDGTLSPEAEVSPYPEKLTLEFFKIQDLRYGENPSPVRRLLPRAGLERTLDRVALKLQGKELSFNNIVDLDAALALVAEFDAPACAIIKHNNPCGVGLGETAAEAYGKALETDPLSAYGGVIGLNVPVDAERRDGDRGAVRGGDRRAGLHPRGAGDPVREEAHPRPRGRLAARLRPAGLDLKRVNGGILAQEWDRRDAAPSELRVVTRRAPTNRGGPGDALRLEGRPSTSRSNAIVYAAKDRTLGIGAGQMSRVDSARLGAEKARRSLSGSALASDAFFPFRDGLDEAAARGVTAVIQPGGSIRDDETIAAADEHGMTMVFTGYRHFRH
jgi:phosphoribosylaminoimidazolecarboxamide formyltransferase/IMP cyclohydrolase